MQYIWIDKYCYWTRANICTIFVELSWLNELYLTQTRGLSFLLSVTDLSLEDRLIIFIHRLIDCKPIQFKTLFGFEFDRFPLINCGLSVIGGHRFWGPTGLVNPSGKRLDCGVDDNCLSIDWYLKYKRRLKLFVIPQLVNGDALSSWTLLQLVGIFNVWLVESDSL
jgi:hypothetical protein